MRKDFLQLVRDRPDVPLAWAGGTSAQNYVNLGDALSAVMVALIAGKPVARVPFVSETPRLVAVGTIGQNIMGGEAWFWGTGCSSRQFIGGAPRRFSADPATVRHVTATRGPISASLLGGGRMSTDVFCDPVWLLPRFYSPTLAKTHELGVLIHLRELADRETECHPKPEFAALRIPAELQGDIKLINTVSNISAAGLKQNLDEILACRRIVSTSLHGLVFAESYGIPCLYFPSFGAPGPIEEDIDFHGRIDLRVADLYLGAGRDRLSFYSQPRREPTDWPAVMRAVDDLWSPVSVNEDALLSAFPAEVQPLAPPAEGDIWDHPVLVNQSYSHDASRLRQNDRAASRDRREAEANKASDWTAWLARRRIPARVAAEAEPLRPPGFRLQKASDGRLRIPVHCPPDVAGDSQPGSAYAQTVAAIAGAPVKAAPADTTAARLLLQDIPPNIADGVGHIWGAGFRTATCAAPTGALAVHATLGPHSAMRLRALGIDAPEIFGAALYFLPKILPIARTTPRFDLGLLLAEGNAVGDQRFAAPADLSDKVRVLRLDPMWSPAQMSATLQEMVACRAVLALGAAGVALAEAYGVPNAPIIDAGGGGRLTTVSPLTPDSPLGFRLADLYAGQGRAAVTAFASQPDQPFDWTLAIDAAQDLDPPSKLNLIAFFEAFPGPCAVDLADEAWIVPGAKSKAASMLRRAFRR